jgi:hypothetical protein
LRDLKPTEFDGFEAERAVGFSSPGGLIECIENKLPELKGNTKKVEGEIAYKYLDNLETLIKRGWSPKLIDVLNCESGCNLGTGVVKDKEISSIIEFNINKRKQEQIKKFEDKIVQKEVVVNSGILGFFKKKMMIDEVIKNDSLENYVNKEWDKIITTRTYTNQSGQKIDLSKEYKLEETYQEMKKKER